MNRLLNITRPRVLRLAQLSLCVLLLVIIRSLSEVFRLQYQYGAELVIGQITPYISGALFAAIALAIVVVCYFGSFYRTVIAITGVTVIFLFVYKVVSVG